RPRQPARQRHVLAGRQLGRPPHPALDRGGVLAAVLGDEALDHRAVGVVEQDAVAVQRDEPDRVQRAHLGSPVSGRAVGKGQAAVSTSAALCPPKPIEVLTATPISAARGVPRTTSRSSSGSSRVRLAVGGTLRCWMASAVYAASMAPAAASG